MSDASSSDSAPAIGDGRNHGSVRLHQALGSHQALGFAPAASFKNVGHKFGRWIDVALLQRSQGGGASMHATLADQGP